MTNIKGKIKFIESHRPALESGAYELRLTQALAGTGITDDNSWESTQKFRVEGDPYQIKPNEIDSVFPPDGSLGDHYNVLPHIILKRSTHPWEYSAGDETPWLALLVFHEDELPDDALTTESLSAFDATLEGQIKVLTIPQSCFYVLPAKEDLPFLTHVRQREDETGTLVGAESAVIVANRLPKPTGLTEVHLVSIKDKYENSNWPGDASSISLVSLKQWRFSCTDPAKNFKHLVLNLDSLNMRLPTANDKIEVHLAKGFVPLTHQLRGGNKIASWYHGPLGLGNNTSSLPLPAANADQLYIYDANNQFFDVSYAAAWELGRLLALKSNDLSVSLYQWKRSHKRQLKGLEQALLHPHIAIQQEKAPANMPEKIQTWFGNLRLLKGIPFNYLVPDERMLPKESIRFFTLDHEWIDSLVDGAFSIGRVSSSDHAHDKRMFRHAVGEQPSEISGFLLRSDLVAGWPNLLFEAYSESIADDVKQPSETPIEVLRREKLSETVLICLFKGEFQTLDFHQKPEVLHFGVDINGNNFSKNLHYVDGKNVKERDLPAATLAANKVIYINAKAYDANSKSLLEKTMDLLDINAANFTSAQFAMAMIEGVEKVRFKKQS